MLVNNAGHGLRDPFVQADPDELEAMLRLHAVAPLRLIRAALPGMLARGRGDVINVSSACIFGADVNQYCATKYYAEAFSRAVAREVQGTGVRVQALLPGYTRTEFFARPPSIPSSAWMEPSDVVQASLASLDLGEVVCLPSVEDTTLLDRIREAQAALIADGMIGALAQRYVARPID
jgi:uncharacterized protein